MSMLKQSTARNVMVFMTSATDHVTGLAGLTLTLTLSKDGGAFAGIAPTVTDRGSGWYSVAATTAHTDTLGEWVLHAEAAGADPTDLYRQVVAALPGEAVTVGAIGAGLIDATVAPNLDAAVSSRLAAGSYSAPPSAAAIRAEIDSNSTKLDATVSSRMATFTYTAPPSAAAIRAEIDSNSTKLDAAVSTRLAAGSYTAAPTAAAIRTEIDTNSTKLDAAISTRLAAAGYTAPDNANIATILARTDVATSTRLASGSYVAPANADVASIKAKTDQLTFSVTGEVDANIESVNGVEVIGNGTTGNEWGPAP